MSKAVYRPAAGAPASPQEKTTCEAWSLDKAQAATFFRLSKPLAEGELHDYDWLPCSIKGRVRAKGRTWDFEINAAATGTLRDGEESMMLGCAQKACEPLVILPREGAQD